MALCSPVSAQDEQTDIEWFESQLSKKFSDSIDVEKQLLNDKRIKAIKDFDAKTEARVMIELATLHLTKANDYEEAMNWLIKSLNLEDSMGLPREKIFTCIAIARVFEEVGNYQKSIEYLNEAQRINKEDDIELLLFILNETGRVFAELGSIDRASEDYEDMLKYAHQIGSRDKEGDALFHLGRLLSIKKEYDQALETHKQALAIRRETNIREKEARSLNNIGLLYLLMDNHDRALANHLVAIKIRTELNDRAGLAESYNNAGALYISKRDFKRAIVNLELALSNSIESQTNDQTLRAHDYLSQCYKELGDFKKALNHKEMLIGMANLIQQEKDERQLLETQNQYVIKQKETEIGQLEIDRRQRDEIIEAQNQLRNSLYLLIVAGTVIGLLVLFLYFQKRRSNKKLKELNETKDKLFSIIGHDLKGPLNSLTAFSSLLIHHSETLTQEEIKMLSGDVDKSLKNLFGLLENLLEWARSQTGNIDFSPEQFDLLTVIIENVDLLKSQAEKKKISIVHDKTQELFVYAHRNSINTVVRNLIANAIKFTSNGGNIVITASVNGKMAKIIVADNGVGMNENVIKKLFKVGTKVSTLGTSQEKGTGLGLILCKDFVEKNGGTIGVESKEGHGSKFYFTVPVK